MLRDAERAGEAGRADAADGDPVAVGQRLDLIVLELRGRAQAGIGRRHGIAGQGGQHADGLVDQCPQLTLVGGGLGAILLVLGRRADDEIAEGGAARP